MVDRSDSEWLRGFDDRWTIIVNRYPRTVPPCPRQPEDNVVSKLISYFVMRYYFRLNSTSTHLFDRFVQQSVYIIIYNTTQN